MADAGGLVLTAPLLDAYVRYARARLTVTAARVAELDKWAQASDAGRSAQRAKASGEVVRTLEQLARADAAARADAGIAPETFEQVDALVHAVVDRRSLARTLDAQGEIATYRALRDKLPPEQRAELEQSFGQMQQDYDAAMALTEERRRYGDAAVELVLSREAELSQLRAQQLASWTGVRP